MAPPRGNGKKGRRSYLHQTDPLVIKPVAVNGFKIKADRIFQPQRRKTVSDKLGQSGRDKSNSRQYAREPGKTAQPKVCPNSAMKINNCLPKSHFSVDSNADSAKSVSRILSLRRFFRKILLQLYFKDYNL
jgi:hypothetical protein